MLSSCLFAVPPGIVGENKLEDVKVKEKHRVTLTCEVIGKIVQYYLPLLIKPMVSIIIGSEQHVFNGIFSSVEFLNLTMVLIAGLSTPYKSCIKFNQEDSCCDISSLKAYGI